MAIITISRQFGAGGRTLGTLLASALDYNLVDEYLIEMVAQKANVSSELVKMLEKEAGGLLQRYISGLNLVRRRYIDPLIDTRSFIDGHHYVKMLQGIVLKLAEEDNVIILGRGGEYILRDHPRTLHLLLIAEDKDRIRFMQDHYHLNRAQAEQVVSRQDKARRNLFRYFGREDYDQPWLYHAVLNMTRLNLECAEELVVKMIRSLYCTA
mgnify:CR=1 FL=1